MISCTKFHDHHLILSEEQKTNLISFECSGELSVVNIPTVVPIKLSDDSREAGSGCWYSCLDYTVLELLVGESSVFVDIKLAEQVDNTAG